MPHTYRVRICWEGAGTFGTASYRSYGRNHRVEAAGPPPIPGSSDPSFRGDGDRWNPEQLIVASLSQCHMLWYLHLCAEAGVVVTDYVDDAEGVMSLNPDGSGQFESVTLAPRVVVGDAVMVEEALALHGRVPEMCFIARSVAFPVHHAPRVSVAG